MGEAYVNMEYVLKVEARAKAAEKRLESVKRELQDADGLAEHRWQQLAEAQERIAELERLLPSEAKDGQS